MKEGQSKITWEKKHAHSLDFWPRISSSCLKEPQKQNREADAHRVGVLALKAAGLKVGDMKHTCIFPSL
jgi:hypothetical protein